MGTLYGIFWSAIERLSLQLVQFVVGIIIARFVLPSDYGLIAMLGIVLAISQTFIDSGFSNALIQKKDVSEIDYSTVFYFNIIASVVLYTVLYLSSSSIASFYHEPQLKILIKYVGLNIVISSFSIVHRAKLIIRLDFKSQAKITFLSVLISGLAGIIMACNDYGVWSLVVQALLNGFLNTLLLFYCLKWLPRFVFSWKAFKQLFSFGSKILASSLLHTIYINLYSLVIGKKYSAADVGFYNRASSMGQLFPINISTIIGRVVYPMQCQLQDEDEELSRYFQKNIRVTSFIVFPITIWLSVLSQPLISILLTERWLPASSLLSILCWGYLWCPISVINNQILNAKGHSDYYFKAEFIKKIIAIAILFITMPLGLVVLCYGIVLYYMLDVLISIYYSKKVIYTGYLDQMRAISLPFIVSVVSGIVILGSIYFFDDALMKLFIGLFVGLLSYISICYLLRVSELRILMSLLRNYRKDK